ncbi:hypothetical protein NVP1121O_045 [Vibrio phage 1.121.O._10N.286.46.C4]|nr:hypothetical protein NVP1121O_045 [Vibrio phage 1.121.O._10N.286.46.C4]
MKKKGQLYLQGIIDAEATYKSTKSLGYTLQYIEEEKSITVDSGDYKWQAWVDGAMDYVEHLENVISPLYTEE